MLRPRSHQGARALRPRSTTPRRARWSIDYKSSDVTEQKAADQRARESLQLKMYALAQQQMTGRLPARVELRFLESGLTGGHVPTESDLAEARSAIEAAAAGIRARQLRRHARATRRAATVPTTRSAPAPPPANRRSPMKLKANGIEINYDKQGSGPVVTLSHSLGLRSLTCGTSRLPPSAAHYTVLRFDTRGPRSDQRARGRLLARPAVRATSEGPPRWSRHRARRTSWASPWAG